LKANTFLKWLGFAGGILGVMMSGFIAYNKNNKVTKNSSSISTISIQNVTRASANSNVLQNNLQHQHDLAQRQHNSKNGEIN
jgi:hypothetical protein